MFKYTVKLYLFLYWQSWMSMSHDPSEFILICWFCAQETFIIIIKENVRPQIFEQ